MEKIRVAFYYTNKEVEQAQLDKIRESLKVDIIICEEPMDLLQGVQYPCIVITEY